MWLLLALFALAFTESFDVLGDGSLVPGADSGPPGRVHVPANSATPAVAVGPGRRPHLWGRAARSGTASRRGCRRQLVETTRKVFVMKRPMPDLVACRHTIRPPPSGCWRAEAGASQ
jgi:hypothetical protein